MRQDLLLGIDIGTQGVKGVLFTREGKALDGAFVKSRLHQPSVGVVEEDPDFQLSSVCSCIRKCMRQSGAAAQRVAAIGIAGQMAGVIGIAEDGTHVTPYDSWLDTRCAPYVTEMHQQAGDSIIRKTGGPVSFNHGPKMLWWLHERPVTYRRIARFVQPGGYVAMRLCGLDAAEAFIDPTYLHFSGFADNPARRWDASLCRKFGIEPNKLPRIVDPHAVIGQLSPLQAHPVPLNTRVAVIAGCGDTAASFLSCGATREGICVDVAGSASVFAATTSAFGADTEHRTLSWGRSAMPGLWHPYAYINGGGMNIEWFVRQIVGKARGSLARLEDLAQQVEPSLTDPLFIPHLGGRVSPSRPHLRGSWAGLSWSHGTGHLYRAMLEAVALEYCIYRDVLRAVDAAIVCREVRITGGGRNSPLWNRIKADALGVPVVQTTREEGAVMGAALLAGVGAGMFDNLPAAVKKWVHTGHRTRPVHRLAGHYQQRLARYRQLLEELALWAQPETS